MKNLKIFIIGCFLIVFTQLGMSMNYNIEVKRLSDRVVLLTGGLWNTNVLVIASEKGLIMIDAPFSNDMTRGFKEVAIEEFKRDDFIYLINSHDHMCHIGGNSVFDSISIIGHDNLYTTIKDANKDTSHKLSRESRIKECDELIHSYNKRFENKPMPNWASESKNYLEQMKEEYVSDYRLIPPNIAFDKQLILDMGDITLKIEYYGYAHSSSDIVVYIPEEQLLFTGGLFYKNVLPEVHIDSSAPNDLVDNWISILNNYTNDSIVLKHIIPSHNGTSKAINQETFVRYKQYIEKLWNDLKVEYNKKTPYEVVEKNLEFTKHFSEFSDLNNQTGLNTKWEILDINQMNIKGMWLLLDRKNYK